MSGFGTTNYDGNNTPRKKDFKLDWGDQTYRVLPPFGSLRHEGKWFQYFRVHWGAGIIDDEGKFRHRPFLCVEDYDFRNRVVRQHCPMCDLINQRKETYELRKAKLKEQGLSEDAIKEELSDLGEWLKRFNTDGKYYINVLSTDGEAGRLPLPKKMKVALETELKELRAKGYDPLSLDKGFWFIFRRVKGERFSDAQHIVLVKKVTKMVDGEEVTVTRPSALSQEQIDAALKGAFDLKEEPPARKLTVAQVESIVSSGFDAEVVKSIMNAAERPERSASSYSNGAPRGAAPAARPQVPAFDEPVPAFDPEPDSDDEPGYAAPAAPAAPNAEAELLKQQMAAMQAQFQQQMQAMMAMMSGGTPAATAAATPAAPAATPAAPAEAPAAPAAAPAATPAVPSAPVENVAPAATQAPSAPSARGTLAAQAAALAAAAFEKPVPVEEKPVEKKEESPRGPVSIGGKTPDELAKMSPAEFMAFMRARQNRA